MEDRRPLNPYQAPPRPKPRYLRWVVTLVVLGAFGATAYLAHRQARARVTLALLEDTYPHCLEFSNGVTSAWAKANETRDGGSLEWALANSLQEHLLNGGSLEAAATIAGMKEAQPWVAGAPVVIREAYLAVQAHCEVVMAADGKYRLVGRSYFGVLNESQQTAAAARAALAAARLQVSGHPTLYARSLATSRLRIRVAVEKAESKVRRLDLEAKIKRENADTEAFLVRQRKIREEENQRRGWRDEDADH